MSGKGAAVALVVGAGELAAPLDVVVASGAVPDPFPEQPPTPIRTVRNAASDASTGPSPGRPLADREEAQKTCDAMIPR
jgi:hypothetical protein